MTIHLRDDSDGHTHQIWAQRQVNSCAVASIWMARNIALQMSMDETEWQLAWRMYHRVVAGMQLTPPTPAPQTLHPDLNRTTNNMSLAASSQDTFENMFASAGTFMNQVMRQLKNDGLTVSATQWVRGSRTIRSTSITDTTPAIVLLGWYRQVASGQWARSGGAFCCGGTKNQKRQHCIS